MSLEHLPFLKSSASRLGTAVKKDEETTGSGLVVAPQNTKCKAFL